MLELVVQDVCDYLSLEDGRQQWFDMWIAKLVSTMGKTAAAKSISILCTAERIAELTAADDEEGDGQAEVVVPEVLQEDVAPASEGAAQCTSL